MRLALRLLPFALLLVASSGCGVIGGSAEPTPTPTATSTPTPTNTPTPTPTPTPVPVLQQPIELAQGRAAVVRVTGSAASASATFNGQEFALLPMQGGFWGVVGVEADAGAGAYPISVTLANGGQLSGTVTVYEVGYPVEDITLPPEGQALLDPALSQREAATRAAVFATSAPERLWSGHFILPAQGPISSPYGVFRSFNGGPVGGFHHGTDFVVDEGAAIVAANAGRVAFAAQLPVRGTSVIIDHGAGVFSGYHHLSSMTVAQGQMVAQGELIAYSGATGLATGPHLHWEIIVRGVTVDPVYWTYEAIGP